MNGEGDFHSLGDVFKKKAVNAKKPPAYPWQDLALRAIGELAIPACKRSSIFKICRDYPKEFIERCLNDTKELCPEGEKWKYFFKIIENNKKKG